MTLLYGARLARPDLLRAITALARRITKWRPMQDQQLHRLLCYLKCTLHHRHVGWVGDESVKDLSLHLYGDADLASDPEDSKSTSGVYMEIQGPDTRFPIATQSKGQTAVSHSTPEAEIVACDHAVRTIGLPALQVWSKLLQIPELKCHFHEDNEAVSYTHLTLPTKA